MSFLLTSEPIDADAVREAVRGRASGAIVVFHGAVRDRSGTRVVTHLEYEAYESMALRQMEAIAREVVRTHGLLGLACTHRLGRLAVGEDAMVVAASSPHRAAALEAIAEFVARLKRDVPIWKKEHFEDGAVWVGTPQDPQGEATAPAHAHAHAHARARRADGRGTA